MESFTIIRDLIDTLQLPALKHDLDTIPIATENFKSYHERLETHLPLLFDCILREPKITKYSRETNGTSNQEIQARLIVLFCEISAPNSIFKPNQTEFIRNADGILDNLRDFSNDVDDLIFKYYQEKLHKDVWKKQLGAIHGFLKYLVFRFETHHDQPISKKFLIFCLSVALNVRSCYETHYKMLSTSIFFIMLQHGNRNDIISTNIHGVIYDAVFKDINIMDSTCFINKQWECLIKCLDFYENIDSFTWNFLDDMMAVLLHNISLAPDSETSICLLKFVNKLTIYFTIDHKDFEDFFEKDLSLVENLNDCRLIANSNTSYSCYRWAKSILQMFTVESYKLMQANESAKTMLEEIHKIYILSILPIHLSIIEPHLIVFYEKFIAVLMETLKVNKSRPDIAVLITAMLETFYYHLYNSEGSVKLNNFKQNIYRLLNSEEFAKYKYVH